MRTLGVVLQPMFFFFVLSHEEECEKGGGWRGTLLMMPHGKR